MESDGNVRTPGSAAYFLVGSSRVPCGPAVSGQLTIPVGRPVSSQDVSGPSLIVQMTPSRSQTQDHHGRAAVVRTSNQPVTMHRFPLQLNHTSANHILSPNQHFKQIPVYQRNTSSIQMESVRKNVFVSNPVASPQLPYNRVGLTPHMLMTYMPPRNRVGNSNNHRTRVVPVNRPNPMLRRDHCPSDDELLEITEHRHVYDAKKPAELVKVEHNYCIVPKVSPQRTNQINGLTQNINVASGQSCIVSPTVSQLQSQTQYNVVNNNNRAFQKSISNTNNNVPISPESLQSFVKHDPPIQVESELSASDHDIDGQGEETDTAPEAIAEGKDNNIKSEEPAVTRCICEMEHDDGFMISCDKCLVWQHVDCVLESRNNLPEEYLCERCSPRPFNKEAAAALQHMKLAKRISMTSSHAQHSSDSDLSSELDMTIDRNAIQSKRKKYKSRQKNVPKRKPNGLPPQIKQRRKNGSSQSQRKKGSMTPEKQALAEERKKMLIKRKEMLLEKKRIAAMDKKKKINQERKNIKKKKTVDSSDDEHKIFNADKSNNKHHSKLNTESSVDQLRNWIDKYEEAVTNHYSQELRARLSSVKPNGIMTSGELRTPVKIPISRTKMSLLPSGIKILVSSSVLTTNQPVIEVRGKFTWTGALAYKDPIPNRTDPFVFFYVVRLSTDCDIEVCVDCRTYGNDARFVRRSCKPNAELKYFIEKGSIHLYIVANQYIEKNSEITINHQVPVSHKYCYCGDQLTCTASMSPVPPPVPTPIISDLPESSSPLIDPTVSYSSEDDKNKPQRNKQRTRQQSSMKKCNKKIVKRVPTKAETPPPPSLIIKNKEANGPGRPKSPVKKVETSPEPDHKLNNNDKMVKGSNEMSREERKMAAIMKAFERLEKKEARKQESRSHKDSDSFNISSPHNLKRNRVQKGVVKRKQRPSSKSSRSKSTRMNRPQRRAAAISSRSYNTSSDEDDNNNEDDDDNDERKIRLLSRKRVQNRCKFSVRFQHRPSTQSSVSRSMLRRSTHNSLLNTPVKIDSEEASGSEGTTPTPLSNTCMLVAAAVGPLAPGFKFPNTKKDFVNAWVKSEGNSPTSEDYKLGESGCAKKRWLQQAISEQDSVGISNGDQQVGPLKKRRMARESMSDCPSPTIPGSGHMSFTEDDVIEDEEVELASRNIASIDSKLTMFENKNIPLINLDLKKSSNTVALVESFLGEFKPDDEGTSEPATPDKINVNTTVENKELITGATDTTDVTLLIKKEDVLVNDAQNLKHETGVSIKVEKEEIEEIDTADIPVPADNPDTATDKTIESVAPIVEQPSRLPTPPPQRPPVKRKLTLSEYRRRKESQANATKDNVINSGFCNVTRPSPSVSPNTSLAAYDEITQQVIAKSLELESKLALKSGPSLFESSLPKEEPKQWENLNDRLRRQFGVNITEDLPKNHPRLSPPPEPIPTIESTRYSYYHRSEEQIYSCVKEEILLPSTAVYDNGPPKLFSPPSQAYFSTMFFRQPSPPPPPPPPPV